MQEDKNLNQIEILINSVFFGYILYLNDINHQIHALTNLLVVLIHYTLNTYCQNIKMLSFNTTNKYFHCRFSLYKPLMLVLKLTRTVNPQQLNIRFCLII